MDKPAQGTGSLADKSPELFRVVKSLLRALTLRLLPPAPAPVVRRRFLLGLSLGISLAIGLDVAPRVNRWSSSVLVTEPGLTASVGTDSSSSEALIDEGQRADPTDFSPQELKELQRRFGVHGPQTPLAQLFTKGLDELTPLRTHTLGRLEELRPTIVVESRRKGINPMLVTAILFDEMQHAKPGEDLPLAAHSGLFSTHGPAQLGLSELVKQGLLSPEASAEEIQAARDQLLDPKRNVELLVGQLARQKKLLGLSSQRPLNASTHPREAKAIATLAYLHNGKLDYPTRILRYMQDPELHALIYSARKAPVSTLI